MVTDRTVKKSRYLIAFAITAATFILGMLLGLFLSGEREEMISKENQIQKLDYESLQMQSLFLTTETIQKNCGSLLETLEGSLDRVEKARKKLDSYILEGKVEEYDLLKREYMLAEIRYWLFAKKANTLCEEDRVFILYFYSNTDGACDDCGSQGLILTSLKETYKDKIFIFAIDGDYANEPMITILKELYNIKSYPTLVINDETYAGLKEVKDVEDVICGKGKRCA